MVTDQVVHPARTILRQTALFVSAAHKKVRKARQPKQTANGDTSTAIESLPRRDTSPERLSRERLSSSREKSLLGRLSLIRGARDLCEFIPRSTPPWRDKMQRERFWRMHIEMLEANDSNYMLIRSPPASCSGRDLPRHWLSPVVVHRALAVATSTLGVQLRARCASRSTLMAWMIRSPDRENSLCHVEVPAFLPPIVQSLIFKRFLY